MLGLGVSGPKLTLFFLLRIPPTPLRLVPPSIAERQSPGAVLPVEVESAAKLEERGNNALSPELADVRGPVKPDEVAGSDDRGSVVLSWDWTVEDWETSAVGLAKEAT